MTKPNLIDPVAMALRARAMLVRVDRQSPALVDRILLDREVLPAVARALGIGVAALALDQPPPWEWHSERSAELNALILPLPDGCDSHDADDVLQLELGGDWRHGRLTGAVHWLGHHLVAPAASVRLYREPWTWLAHASPPGAPTRADAGACLLDARGIDLARLEATVVICDDQAHAEWFDTAVEAARRRLALPVRPRLLVAGVAREARAKANAVDAARA